MPPGRTPPRAPCVQSLGYFPVIERPRWENDADATVCRKCQRKFTLFFRKHHCRRCGRIFCDACTSRRVHIPENVHATDPALPEMLDMESGCPVRVCDDCIAAHGLEPEPRMLVPDLHQLSLSQLFFRHSILQNFTVHDEGEESEDEGPEHDDPNLVGADEYAHAQSESTLFECPVCEMNLHAIATSEEREQHVAACLERGMQPSHAHKKQFVVSSLQADSALVGRECIICMEDFLANDQIARLTCMCCFHAECIRQWFAKGHGCPVHATDADA